MKKLFVVLLAVLVVGCSANSPTGPSPVPVVQKTLVDLTISSPTSVKVGETQQSTATVKWSDNTTEDVTKQVTWKSTAMEVAEIDSVGIIKGRKAGETLVWVENYQGRNYRAKDMTVVEAPAPVLNLDLQVLSPQNGATLRLARPGVDVLDRLMAATGTLPTAWLNENPTARIWVCFKNKPGSWILGSCDHALATGRWEFRPYLTASNTYHASVGETTEVALFLTVGVDQGSFYRLEQTGDPYQRSDADPAIVWSVTKPLRVSHR
jgi:hypothetical protein